MTARELVAILDRLGLSQAEAARISGYEKGHVNRACTGRIAVPQQLATIILLVDAIGLERAREALEAADA